MSLTGVQIRNAILYTLVTTHHFVDDEEGAEGEAAKPETDGTPFISLEPNPK